MQKRFEKYYKILFALLFIIIFLNSFVSALISEEVNKDTYVKTSNIQIPFIENNGQIKDNSIRFYAEIFSGEVFITDKGEIIYDLIQESPAELKKALVLKETLVNSKNTGIRGINQSETNINYFIGNQEDWRTNIKSWNEIGTSEIYNNIDIKLKAYGKNIEKIFTIHKKGYVKNIKLKIEGIDKISINKNKELELKTEIGSVNFKKPYAYQIINGKRIEVAVSYKIIDSSEFIYGFKVGKYDKTKDLIIDPLIASTFIGGGGEERPPRFNKIIFDSSGNIFITGYTKSSSGSSKPFPTTLGVYSPTSKGTDAFVSKFDSTLSTLIASTFIGGSGSPAGAGGIESIYDEATSIAIDSSQNIVITGHTKMANFPTTSNAYDRTLNGSQDGFISKFSNDLSTLIYSTLIGGNNSDIVDSVVIDSSGSIIVKGHTDSLDFPTTSNAYDKLYNGDIDGFISKFSSDLSTLTASTYLGGSGEEFMRTIALDSSGNIFVSGRTTFGNYPTTPNAYDTVYSGSGDAVVSKLSNDLSKLLASTFIGAGDTDDLPALTIDSSGNIFAGGYVALMNKTTYGYPVTSDAYDKTPNGGVGDMVLSKFDNNLSKLLASTFIGGSYGSPNLSAAGDESIFALITDSSGNIYITGWMGSYDFPTTQGAYDTILNGGAAIPLLKMDNNLSKLLASTFIDGSFTNSLNEGSGRALGINSLGNIVLAGWTDSYDFPTTLGAYDTSTNGGPDVFLLIITPDLAAGPPPVCTDDDSDGYKIEGGSCGIIDCNDTNSLINPGIIEGPAGSVNCTDGKDNDCDGKIDLLDSGCQITSPDLIVSVLSANPASVCPGDSIAVNDTTKNNGSATTGTTSTTAFYFSADLIYDENDILLNSRAVPILATGAISKSATTLTIPLSTTQGVYYIIANADDENFVSESNENNNEKLILINVDDSGVCQLLQTCLDLGGTEKCSSTQNCNGNTITGASDLQIGEICCQGTCENVVSDSMILYYPFDRGDINLSTKIILDRSGFGNNGIMLGARFLKTTNHSGAMIFNNTDYITCGNKQSLQLNKSFTLSAWVYPADLSKWNTVIEVGDSINNRYGMRVYLDSLYAVTDNTYLTSYYNGISEKQWQHVAVSYNYSSNTKQYFVNGALMRTTSNEIDSPSPNGGCQIGHSNADLNFGFFQGIIDEVRIYNYPLSSTEISNIYNGKDYHDADADKNGFIELSEMFNYVDNWFKGNIEMNNLAVAVHIWKKGYSYINNLPGKTCIDNDVDGYNTTLNCGIAIDCDDNDIAVNPGASEICNDGVDNNCDGQIDEGCSGCTDDDGDGYNTTLNCGIAIDCDDNDIAVNPGATEGPNTDVTCSDGKDNDCDNLVDSNDPNCVSLQSCSQLGGEKCLITQTCTGAAIQLANDVNYGSGETCCNATTGTCQNLLSCSNSGGNDICSGNSYCPNPSLNKINANDTLPVIQGKTCCKIPCQQAVSYLSCSAQSGTICQTSDYKCSGNVIPSNDTTYSWSALMCCIGNCTKGTTATCSSQGGNICAINQYCNGSSELLNAGDVKYGYDSATGRGGETCCIGQCASLTTATDFAGRNWYLLPWLESETRAYSKNLAQRESDYLAKYGENWAGLKNGNYMIQSQGDWRWETIDVLPDNMAVRVWDDYPNGDRWGLRNIPRTFVWWPDGSSNVTDVYVTSTYSFYHFDPKTGKRNFIGKPEHHYGSGLRDGINEDAIMSSREEVTKDEITGRIYFIQHRLVELPSDKGKGNIPKTLRYVDKLFPYKCTDVNPNQVYYLPAFLDWHNLYQQVKGPNGCNLALVINSTTGQRDSIWYIGTNFNFNEISGYNTLTNPARPDGDSLWVTSEGKTIWFARKSPNNVMYKMGDTNLQYASLFDILNGSLIKNLNLNAISPKTYEDDTNTLGSHGASRIGYDDNFYVIHHGGCCSSDKGGNKYSRAFSVAPNTGEIQMLYNSIPLTGAVKPANLIVPFGFSPDGPADSKFLRSSSTRHSVQSPRTGAIFIGGWDNFGIKQYHDGFVTTFITGAEASGLIPRNNLNWQGWNSCGSNCNPYNKVPYFGHRNNEPDIAPDGSTYQADATSPNQKYYPNATRIFRIYRTDWPANQPVGGYYKSLFPDAKLEQLRIDFAKKYIADLSNFDSSIPKIKTPSVRILINNAEVNRPVGGAGIYNLDVTNGAVSLSVSPNVLSSIGAISNSNYRWEGDNTAAVDSFKYNKTWTFVYKTNLKQDTKYLTLQVTDSNAYRGYDVVIINLTNSTGK